MTASVSAQAEGVLGLTGVLDYRSGPALLKQGQQLIVSSAGERLVVDCSGVEKSSSVGLSLLLAFSRAAQARGKSLVVKALPADMAKIAEVYGIGTLLTRD